MVNGFCFSPVHMLMVAMQGSNWSSGAGCFDMQLGELGIRTSDLPIT